MLQVAGSGAGTGSRIRNRDRPSDPVPATGQRPPAAPRCIVGRDRFHLYRVAAGSAAEVRTALALAANWGYIAQPQAAPAHALLDRVVAILWRLTHPKR